MGVLLDLQLDFQNMLENMPETKSIRRHIEKEVEQLDHKFEGIKNCHVTFDLPYHHRYPGNIYNFEIRVVIPEEEIIVTRGPSVNADETNIIVLIRDAFNELNRKLKNCACEKPLSDEPASYKNQKRLFERAPKSSDTKIETRV